MGQQVKFKNYGSLLAALKRGKVQNPGITATTLLECFVCNDGQLRAGLVVERGLCEEGKFTAWRKGLIDKGWLVYVDGEYARHKPGAKLLRYINKEKMVKEELATVSEVQRVDSKVDALTEELAIMRIALEKHILEHDPPLENKVDNLFGAAKSDFAKTKAKKSSLKTSPFPPYKPDEESENFH